MSSVSNAVSMGQMQITIAKKQLEAIQQEGEDAVKLMEAAAPPAPGAPPANTAAGVGTHVNIKA